MISELIAKIRNAILGIEVRDSIADAIEDINEVAEATQTRQQSLENSFNGLIINAGNSNAEIVDARGAEITLKTRLDKADTKLVTDISNMQNEVDENNTTLTNNVNIQIQSLTTKLNEALQAQSTNVVLFESANGVYVTGTVINLTDDITKYYDIVVVCDFNGYYHNTIVSDADTTALRGINLADTPLLTSKNVEFYEVGIRKINSLSYEITRNNRIVENSSGAITKEVDSDLSKIKRIYAKKKIVVI